MLNVAIVGLGRWGQRLVDSVQEGGKPRGDLIRFTRAVTRTPSNAADYAATQGLELGDDYDAVLNDPAIDAVALATPHSQHADQVIVAARAGKQVFVDKPFTLGKENAERAVTACRDAGVLLAVGQNRRFLPNVLALKDMLARGELGALLHVEGNFSSPLGHVFTRGMWRADAEENPAGGMTPMGIHTVDSFIFLFGRIAAVQAISQRRAIAVDTDDTTVMLFRFESGMTGYFTTMTATARVWRIQAFGSKGWVHLPDQDELVHCAIDAAPETQILPQGDIERAELEAFARAVAGDQTYPVPTDEAIHGIAVLDAIIDSTQRNGALVEVA